MVRAAGLDGLVIDAELAGHLVTGDVLGGERLTVDALRADLLDVKEFAAASELAHRLDAKRIVLRPTIGYPVTDDWSAWRERGACGARQGVTVAVDLCDHEQFDARAMSKFIKDVAHERVRLCFDFGAYASGHPFSHWEVALQRVVADLAVLGLSDATGTPGDTTRPPLGEGTIDFLRVNEILRPMNLDALAVVDVDPPRRGRGTVTEQCTRALEQSTQHLRRCGWFDP